MAAGAPGVGLVHGPPDATLGERGPDTDQFEAVNASGEVVEVSGIVVEPEVYLCFDACEGE